MAASSPAAGTFRGGAQGPATEETTTASDQASGGQGDPPPGPGAGGQPGRPGLRFHGRYGLLLIILITSYLLSAFFNSKWINDAQLALFTFAGFLAIRSIQLRRRTVRLIGSAGFLISVVMIVVGIHQGGATGRGVASIWTGVLLLFVVVVIVRQVLSQSEVTLQSIYGAISAYLIIGLMFAAFYAAAYYLGPSPFFANRQAGSVSIFQYFSFTTLTTLGYGDYTAFQSGGRAVAMLEAMTGQIFLSVLVAKLVSSFRPSAAAARGTADGAASDDG